MKLKDIELRKDLRREKLEELLVDIRETERLERKYGMNRRINNHKLERLLLWTLKGMEKKSGMNMIELINYYLDLGFTSEQAYIDIFHNIEDKEFVIDLMKSTTEGFLNRCLKLTINSLLREERFNNFEDIPKQEREEMKRQWDERKRKIEEYVNIEKLVETIEHNKQKPKGSVDHAGTVRPSRSKSVEAREKYKRKKRGNKFEETGEQIEW